MTRLNEITDGHELKTRSRRVLLPVRTAHVSIKTPRTCNSFKCYKYTSIEREGYEFLPLESLSEAML
jgi:hypothetical protein